MTANLLTNWMKKLLSNGSRRERRRWAQSINRSALIRRPLVELLEDRITPTGWMVNSLADTNTGTSNSGTLRYCLTGAATGDTISFSVTGTITTTSTLPTIANGITITGPGASSLAVDGNVNHQVFNVTSSSPTTISGLTIQNGRGDTGGGINNSGTLTLTNDLITNNAAAGTANRGGGLYNSGTMMVSGCTFSHNTTSSDGGAIYNIGTLSLSNTTISNNTAYTTGGGIGNLGTVSLTDCTVSYNSGFGGNTALPSYGGGISNNILAAPSASLSLDNTIVANNYAVVGADIVGSITTANYDLIGNSYGITAIGSGAHNIMDVNPGLGTLANNGGPTATVSLLAGSPARGAGDPGQHATTAQNGVVRPSLPDIGAYQTPAPTVTVNTAALPNNFTLMTITGTGFSPTAANDTVTFNDGVTGTVTSATGTSLTVALTGLGSVSAGTALNASATVFGQSSGSLVQVGAVAAPAAAPTVTSSASNLADSATTLTISGTNFDPTAANDSVAFNLGVVGTVTAATPTSLTVTLSSPPTALGSLTAVVSSDGVSSGAAVQVATEVNGTWVVNSYAGSGGSLANVTLPYAVASALSGDAITFASSLAGATINLGSTLTVNSNVTIDGSGAPGLSISGIPETPGLVGTYFNISPATTSMIQPATASNPAWLGLQTPAMTAQLLTSIDMLNIAVSGFANPGATPYYNLGAGANNQVEARWYGEVLIPGTGTTPVPINFATTSDDGSTLYVDGNLVVNNNRFQGATQRTGLVNLTPGLHAIDIEYYNGGGGANMVASWNPTGGSTFVPIPSSAFFSPLSPIQVIHVNTGVTASISNLTIENGSAATGGGVQNAGTLTLTGDTITGNTATAKGGGIANSGALTVVNSTVAFNTAVSGGGIYSSATGTLTLSNATVAYNTATTTGGGVDTLGTATIQHSIVTGDTGGDVSGSFTNTNNVIGGSNVVAAALANNGGPTQTLATVAGSAAIGTGTGTLPTDQRGFATPTPQDIGAFQELTPSVTLNTANLPDSSASITINGTNFSPIAALDSVVFNLGVTGTVTSATATQLTVAITSAPTALGSLTAVVTSAGHTSGAAVQVATEVNGTWTVVNPAASGGNPSNLTLPYAIAATLSGDNIAFSPSLSGDTITMNGTITLNHNVTIDGSGAPGLKITAVQYVTQGLQGTYFNIQPSTSTIYPAVASNPAWLGNITPSLTALLVGPIDFPQFGTGVGNLGFTDVNGVTYYNNVHNDQNVDARWYGEIMIPGTGTSPVPINFQTGSDDGSNIYVDGNLVVNNNTFQGVTYRSGIANLVPGLHSIDIEYYNGGGGAAMFALWDPTGGTNFVDIPNDAFLAPTPTQVFNIPAGVTTTISNLTIENGSAASGGGVKNAGTLTLSNDTVKGNTATNGAGIFNSGTLTVSGTTVNNNNATADGGGIGNTGALTVINSTVVYNTAATAGGIGNSGTLNLSNDTIAYNTAAAASGLGTTTTATVNNTIIGNNNDYTPGLAGTYYNLAQSSNNGVNPQIVIGASQWLGHQTPAVTAPLVGPLDFQNISGNGFADSIGTPAYYNVAGGNNNVEARWYGEIDIPNNGAAGNPISFGISSDDGSVIYIDGNAIVSMNNYQGAPGYPGLQAMNTVDLAPGLHTIDVEYYNGGGGTAFWAQWDPMGGSSFVDIPNSVFSYATPGGDVAGTITGSHNLTGETTNLGLATTLTNTGGPTLTLSLTPGSPAIGAGGALTTATSAIAATDTTIQVANAAAIAQTAGSYPIYIGAEELLVTNVNTTTNTLTVVRGYNGTTAAAYATGTAIYPATDQRGVGRQVPVAIGAVDENVWIVTDPNGAAGSGSYSDVTLPFAINAVNNGLGLPIIEFAPTLSGDTITLNGTLDITKNVTITGLGATNLTVSGNNAVQDFNVASGVTASISGLTITGGSGMNGGGVVNAGNLTLSNDTITGNAATSNGGGVYNTGTLTVSDITSTGNTAANSGSGLYNATGGTLNISSAGTATTPTTINDNIGAQSVAGVHLDGTGTTNIAGNINLGVGTLTDSSSGNDTVTGVISGGVSTVAYVGFTGGTGGANSTQNILNWDYSSSGTNINYSSGFPTNPNLVLNGGASIVSGALQLTDSNNNEARTAWTPTVVPITNFTSSFEWNYIGTGAPTADGFTFSTQTAGNTYIGGGGGSLGYAGATGNSISVQYNLYSGVSNFGVSFNGVVSHPIDLTPYGINFHTNANDNFMSTLTEVGNQLTVDIWDATMNPTGSPTGGDYYSNTFTLPTLPISTSLNKTGTGTLTLSNANTYAGFTNISGGTLVATVNGAMGPATDPGIVVSPGGALGFSGGVNYSTAEPLTIGGSGPAGNGAIESLSGNNTLSIPVSVPANGTIGSDAGSTLTVSGDINLTGTNVGLTGAGIINVTGNVSLGGFNGNLTDTASGQDTVSGLISGGGQQGLDGQYFNISPATTSMIDNTQANWLGNQTPAVTAVLAGLIDFPNIQDEVGNTGYGFTDNVGNDYYNLNATVTSNSNNNVEARWFGNILIPGTGTSPIPINFETGSDDGSTLYIDGNLVVNNNFFQGVTNRTGLVNLTPGLHTIDVEYYNGGGGAAMFAEWDPTGGSNFVEIPSSAFSRDSASANNVIMKGTGSLTLSHVNTYTGNTTIDNGTLIPTLDGAMGPATAAGIIINGGALGLTGGISYNTLEPITISGSGPAGNGAIESISGTNSDAGPITVNGYATIGADAGALTLSGNIGMGTLGNLTVTGAGNTTLSGTITGTATVAITPGLIGQYFNITAAKNLIQPANASNPNWLGNQTPAVTAQLIGPLDFPDINNSASSTGFADSAGNPTYYDLNTSPGAGSNNNVEGRWFGEIIIPGTGTTPVPINFATSSDDGSTLYIDGNLVVNNNFFQGATQRTGLVNLTPGLHAIDVEYYQGGGGASMDAQWDPTGGTTFVDIPNSAFEVVANTLTKNGAGTLTLSNTDAIVGPTTVDAGVMKVNGTLGGGTTVTVNSGGSAGGTGTFPATTVNSGGSWAPGDPSTTTAASLTLTSGANFVETLGGATTGTYDQTVIQSGGHVTLGGSTLNLSLVNGFTPSVGQSFTIINNQSGTTVSGTFAQGSTITAGGYNFAINYAGGTSGDNVVLTVVSVSTSPTVTGVSPNSGPAAGGTVVTITGINFTGATAVDFGTNAATNVTVNAAGTQITATDPAGTGTVDVTVTTPTGTSATSPADQFTYVAAPTVTGLSPTTGPAAGGTVVTITGTGFTSTATVSFGTTAATNVMFVSATSLTAVAPAGTGVVDVTVTTAGGTSATSSADQYTYIAVPTVTSVSPNSGPTAGGTVVTITGTGFTQTGDVVDFGTNAATGVTVNAAGTQITATSPAGALGTVDVTVTTAGGTSATSSADDFTYVTAATTFQVTSTVLLPGDNGFLVTFSAPYNISELSLYDGDSGHTLTTRDVQITLGGTTIFGGTGSDSVKFNEVPVSSTSLEIIETGLNHVAPAKVLAAGNYVVTLLGGTSNPGFRRLSDSANLDGSGSGTLTAVDNYVSPSLDVSAIPASTAIVSIGNLVAGPGQTLTVPLVLGGGTGSVSDVTSVDLTVTTTTPAYTITGFTANSSLPSGVSTAYNVATGVLDMSSATPFSSSDNPLLLGTFTVAVPGLVNGGTAPGIDTKTPLTINVTSVGDTGFNAKPFVGVNSFDVTGYLGNVIAPVGVYNSTDVSQVQGLIVGSVKAFALYPNVDPSLVADVNKDGSVNATDVSQLQARIINSPATVLPALPAGASGSTVNGADPVLFVGSIYTPNGQPANLGNLTPGSTVLVPLSVFVTDPHGVNLTAAEAAFSFDPKVFMLDGVSAGSIAGGRLGGSPFAIDFSEVAPGELVVIGSSSFGPNLAYGQTATLFLVSLTVRADAPLGSTGFNLLSSEAGLQTGLQDNLGRSLVLTPAPSNNVGNNLDGAFTVQSGKAVQHSGIQVGTTGKAGSVTALTPTAWEQLTTQLFGTAGNPLALNGSNGGLAVAATGPIVTETTEGKKQGGSNSLAAWEHLTTQLFKAEGNQTELNGNPTTL